MELKKILKQNTQQASSNLNYFSERSEHLRSPEEASIPSLNSFSVIPKITASHSNRNGHLQARYGDITSALMKTHSAQNYPRTGVLITKEYNITKI
jgi:hypothetical protein